MNVPSFYTGYSFGKLRSLINFFKWVQLPSPLPFLLIATVAFAADPVLPDPKLTPGVAMSNVTVEQICSKGYANILNGGVRNVPGSEKRAVFIEYFGKVPFDPGAYEIDHLISLEIGGSNNIKNLWPEAYTNVVNSVNVGAHTKDKLEDRMAALLRADLKANGHDHATALMKQFQSEIATNWISAYKKYVTNETKKSKP